MQFLAGGRFTPSARTRTCPPPRTIVSCGYRENGRSILRPSGILDPPFPRAEKKKKFGFSEFLIFSIGKEVEKLKYLFVSFFYKSSTIYSLSDISTRFETRSLEIESRENI